MSRDDYRQRDAGPPGRDTGSHLRPRRRASAPGPRMADVRADDAYGYGSADGGHGHGGYDAPYGESYGYGPAGDDGYGPDGQAGADYAPNGNGYDANGYPAGGYDTGGYAQAGYDNGGYAQADGYGGAQAGYADDGYGAAGYGGQGYAGDGYGAGGYPAGDYAGHGRDAGYGPGPDEATGQYQAADPYAADPYAAGPYAAAGGPQAAGDPYAADPYADGGYAGRRAAAAPEEMPGLYRDADSYAASGDGYSETTTTGIGSAGPYGGQDGFGQDGFAGQDPYEDGTAAGYGRGGYDDSDDSFGRGDSGSLSAVDDPGLMRRRSGARDSFDADDARHDGFFRGFGSHDDDLDAGGRRSRPARTARKRRGGGRAGLVALLIVVVVIAGIGGVGYKYYSKYHKLHSSYAGNGFGSAMIQVKSGDSFDTISAQLLSKNVIEAIDPWDSFVAGKTGLQPGTYKIHKHMSPAAAFAALTSSKNLIQDKVTVPDGMRETDILTLLAKDTRQPLSAFDTAIKDTAALGLPSWAKGNPEGFLYPDTYTLEPGEKPLAILQTMVKEFNAEAAKVNLVAAASTVHYTPYQILIGASLLEGEVGPQYFGQVARVIDNRINTGMPLQLDSTIAYAMKVHTDNLTDADHDIKSPYNTFTNTDLPPTPIDSPDIAAIQAFLHPPHGDWLYFVTVDKKGTTDFTDSSSQFQEFAALAKKNGVTS